MAAILLRALLAFTIILGATPARAQPFFDWSGLYNGLVGEKGWGINLAVHGDAYFISWLTYDTDGSQMWLVVPRAAPRVGPYGLFQYSGPMYRTTGPAFSQVPWDPSAVGVTQVGTGMLSLENISDEYLRFTYVLYGVNGYKNLSMQEFGALPRCVLNGTKPVYQDLWWGGAAESGWGLHVNHQGDVVFAIWLTYDAAGRGSWVVMPRGERIGASESFSGALYRTTGPSFNSEPWDSSRVIVTEVGRATLDFADIGHGTFTYTMQGVTQSKAITRQGVSATFGDCRVP